MSARPELRALTGARGIAAWIVVLFHLRYHFGALGGPDGPFAHGYLAVDFFFVLSGFVIWLTYAERLHGGGFGAAAEFLRRRIARVWPLHLFVLAGAVMFALVLAMANRPDWAQYPPAQLPLHVLLLQNWGFTDRLTWNVPAWSISCELAAYLLFPLLCLAVDWRRWPSLALIAMALAIGGALWAVFASWKAVSLGEWLLELGIVRCLAEFAIGTIVCALWQRWRDRPALPALASAAVCAALMTAHLTGLLPQTAAIPLAFAALVLLLALTAGLRGNPLEGRVIHYLGEISYATYLGHWMLWMGFKLLFVPEAGMGWPLFSLFAAMVVALSAALYHAIERPAQKWVNALPLKPLPFRGGVGVGAVPERGARGEPSPPTPSSRRKPGSPAA